LSRERQKKTVKLDPLCFAELKEHYLLDIKVVVEMEMYLQNLSLTGTTLLFQGQHG